MTQEQRVAVRYPTIPPSLVIGLGGTGVDVVRQLKRRLVQTWWRDEFAEALYRMHPTEHEEDLWARFEQLGGPPVVQLLAVDSDCESLANRPGATFLNRYEKVYLGGFNASQVVSAIRRNRRRPSPDPTIHPQISRWWQWDEEEFQLGQIYAGARQIRAIGRLAFFFRFPSFERQLQHQCDTISSLEAIENTEKKGYVVADTSPGPQLTQVYIVASVCGGTGAGIFLDVAARVRLLYGERARITGIFVLPSVFLQSVDSDLQKLRIQANAYAALRELDYFQSYPFDADFPGKKRQLVDPPLFNFIHLVERSNEFGLSLNSIEDTSLLIANQLYLEIMNHIGGWIRQRDVNVTIERESQGRDGIAVHAYSSFANASLVIPEDLVREYITERYAKDILTRVLRPLTPAEENALQSRVLDLRERLDELASQEAMFSSASESLPDAEPIPVSPRRRYQGMCRELVSVLQSGENRPGIPELLGLRGLGEFFDALRPEVDRAVQEAARRLEQCQTELDTTVHVIQQLRGRQPWYMQVGHLFPFSAFLRGTIRARQERIAVLQEEEAIARAEVGRAQEAYQAWSMFARTCGALHDKVRMLLDGLESWQQQNLDRRLRELTRQASRPREETLYELKRLAVAPRYFEEDLYPQLLKEHLGGYCQDDAASLNRSLQVEIRLSTERRGVEGTHAEELHLEPGDARILGEKVYHIARKRVSELFHSYSLSIKQVLASHIRDVQIRLKQVAQACQPFWSYRLEEGGFSDEDLERIRVVGVARADSTGEGLAVLSPEYIRSWNYVFRDHLQHYELVETHDAARIDVCHVAYGLPIAYLSSLPQLYACYKDFRARFRGPLHVDARWVDPGKKEREEQIELPHLLRHPELIEAGEPSATPDAAVPPEQPAGMGSGGPAEPGW